MKSIFLTLLATMSLSVFAYNPSLTPAINSVQNCLNTQKVLLCDTNIRDFVKTLSMDVRGEFALYLKEEFTANNTDAVILNLYSELKVLVPIYEQLDTCNQWSCRNLKSLSDDVAVQYVKATSINIDLLTSLYNAQSGENGRYNLLMTLKEKMINLTDLKQIDDLVQFLSQAKEISRTNGDAAYLYRASVDLIRQLTTVIVKQRPGFEGVYSIKFDDADAARDLRIDTVTIMESNNRDALVVNFVGANSSVLKIGFDAAGILGNTVFSNEDVYNNNQNAANPYFKFELNPETRTIKGIFSTVRFGELSFTGEIKISNLSIYSQENIKGLSLDKIAGSYNVIVGSSNMKLIIRKRASDRLTYEAALFNDNAMVTFSKVSLDSDRGVLSLVDSNNDKKLTLGFINLNNVLSIKGQLLNSSLAKVFEVKSL